MNNKNKLCVDCKWCINDSLPSLALCTHPKNILYKERIDHVTGNKLPIEYDWKFCFGHRMGAISSWFWSRFLGLCGKDGRWFTPKK